MNIAIVSEVSAKDKNEDLLEALSNRGHTIHNIGVSKENDNELLYTHTGLIAALAIHTKRADMVVGGCGTGQGFLISVSQYPGVFCGHLLTPLDAWLFTQINGGNCIALAFNQGYGWAGDVNLQFLFDRLFEVEAGCGYPAHRKEPQEESRRLLSSISAVTHRSMEEILQSLDRSTVERALNHPGIKEFLNVDDLPDSPVKETLADFYR